MNNFVQYRESYPSIERMLKKGKKMQIFCDTKKNRKIFLGDDENFKEITRPHLADALACLEDCLCNKVQDNEIAKAGYPLSYDIADMHIYKGRILNIFYALEKNTFVCVSTITEDLKHYIRYDVDCCYGTADNVMSAITNSFISPRFQLKDHLADYDELF